MNASLQPADAPPRPNPLRDSLLPWRAANPTAASFRFAGLVAVYGALFYVCLGPLLFAALSLPLTAVVRGLGGTRAAEDLAAIPVVVVMIVLYALGPLGCVAGIVCGIRGLAAGGRGRALVAAALNAALLLGIAALFLLSAVLSL